MTAYDALDTVQVVVRVEADAGDGSPLHEVLSVSLSFKGTGEPEASTWLRDALVALAERV